MVARRPKDAGASKVDRPVAEMLHLGPPTRLFLRLFNGLHGENSALCVLWSLI